MNPELSAAKAKLSEWRFSFYAGAVVAVIIFIVGIYNDYIYVFIVAGVALVLYPFVSMAKNPAYENYRTLKIESKVADNV